MNELARVCWLLVFVISVVLLLLAFVFAASAAPCSIYYLDTDGSLHSRACTRRDRKTPPCKAEVYLPCRVL
jgi:hypothetical protein